jgi:ABC-type sugar transport system ATPase subunit
MATSAEVTAPVGVAEPPAQGRVAVRCRDLAKRFHGSERDALTGVDLLIPAQSITVILGPSGCGKTTLLRCIAGLDTPSRGSIEIGTQNVTAVPAEIRGVAMVFQNYALYPNKTVLGNLEFPLRMTGVGRRERRERALEVARMLQIEELLGRRPGQLSGGQRQRVGIGRALVRRPSVLLMDEPFSSLDAELRTAMRAELLSLQARLGMAVIFVTHDQVEALSLADQLVVMRSGHVEQAGAPEHVFGTPDTEFVASFLGGMNILPAGTCPLAQMPSGASTWGIRPEDIRMGDGGPEDATFSAEVTLSELHGRDRVLHLAIGGQTVRMLVPSARRPSGQITVHVRPDDAHYFAGDGRRPAPQTRPSSDTRNT